MNSWVSATIPGTPPSVNEVPLDSRNPRYRRIRDDWKTRFAYAFVEKGNVLPRRLDEARASVLLTFTQSRRRDAGNYAAIVDKVLGDILQETGRLPDDTPQFYTFGAVTFALGECESTTLMVRYTLPREGLAA